MTSEGEGQQMSDKFSAGAQIMYDADGNAMIPKEFLKRSEARRIAEAMFHEANEEDGGDLEIVGTAHLTVDGGYSFAAVSPGSDLDSCFIVVHPDGSTEGTPIPPG